MHDISARRYILQDLSFLEIKKTVNKKNFYHVIIMGVLPLYVMPLLITEGTSENRKSCLLELYYMYMSSCLTEKL